MDAPAAKPPDRVAGVGVMKLRFQLMEAIESLRAHLLRSFLTMLGIIIGVAALITMLSVGSGAQVRITQQIDALGANLLMVLPASQNRNGHASSGRNDKVRLTLVDVNAIATSVPGIAAAAPALQGRARLVHGNKNWSVRINGTTADYFFIRDWPLIDGRVFSSRDERQAGKVAVIGQTAARRLFGDASPVGREIRIRNAPVLIIGLLDRKGQSGSGRDQDDILFVPYRTALTRFGSAERTTSPQMVSYILAKASSDAAVPAAIAGLEALMQQRHPRAVGQRSGLRVVDPVVKMKTQRESSQTVAWLLAAIAAISMIVGGISIMNIMLVSVGERTREIGLHLALGARPRDIRRLVLLEASLICTSGGVLGVALGLVGSWTVAKIAGWQVLVVPDTILLAVVSATATGLFFGYFPARKAAGMSPAAALRTD